MLRVGDTIPEFITTNQDGISVSSGELLGHWVVLYFYPKDNTPGCTIEACDFRDSYNTLKNLGCKLFGISKDSAKSHTNFMTRYKLPFDLLSDTSGDLCEQFGVLVEKSMFGKKYFGIQRATFLINPAGKIVYVWGKVKITHHTSDVLETLRKNLP